MTSRAGRRARSGFTLIEIMAVVVILLLIAGVVIPQIAKIGSRAAVDDAKRLAATLDYARQKAIALGRAHRVVLDFERAQYWIEAQPPPEATPPIVAWAALEELPLVAPRSRTREFLAQPGARPTLLQANVRIAAVEDDASQASEGLAQIAFEPDGATQAAVIWLAAGDGVRVRVDVAPLADPTRVKLDAPE